MTHRYKGSTVTIDRHEPDGTLRIKLPGGRTRRVDPSELSEERRHSPPVRVVEEDGMLLATMPDTPGVWLSRVNAPTERSTGTVSAPLVEQPKPTKAWRSSSHLDLVRGMACCVCASGPRCEAHHVGPHPMGRKPPDSLAAPLCPGDHERWHKAGRVTGSRSRGDSLRQQWDGVTAACQRSLGDDLSSDDMDDIAAEAAEAAAKVWARALEER